MQEEVECGRPGLTRARARRDGDYKVDDEITSVLRVTVLDGHDLDRHRLPTAHVVGIRAAAAAAGGGPYYPRLILGENDGVGPAVHPGGPGGRRADFDCDFSFPVHPSPIVVEGTTSSSSSSAAARGIDDDNPSSRDVDETAAAVKIQNMWRRTGAAIVPPPRAADDYTLVVEVIEENDRGKDCTIGRGYIKYRDLLKEGGNMRTMVELTGHGGGFRKKITGHLNVECRLEEFSPSEGAFPIPTLSLLNNLNTRGGMIRDVLDGGTFEPFPTWQMKLWEVGRTFNGEYSHFNEKYSAAQLIFGPGLQSRAIREGLRAQHSMLYFKDKTKNHLIHGISSFIAALPTSNANSTPGMSLRFTYVILTNSYLHFSITSKKTAQDFLSKHALHNRAGREVAFAGEFFIDRNSDRARTSGVPAWIIDNNSGTYAPAKEKLHLLQALLEFNFGRECPIFALDRSDPALSEYFNVNKVE